MSLNLGQVRAFVTVIDSGGFLDAAKELGCAQPTVTQLIRKLETELGHLLVVRNRTRCVATPAGDLFLPHARRLLHAEDRAIASLAGRSLKVGASGNIGTYLLPPYIRRFNEASGIEVDLVIEPNPNIADRLEAGDVDIAIMEWWDGRQGFSASVWRREPLVIIVAKDHPWAGERTLERRRLLEVPLIGGEPGTGTGRILQSLFGKDGARLRTSMELGSTAAVKEAVKAGLGVSIVLKSTVHDDVAAGSLIAIPLSGEQLEKELMVIKPDNVPPKAPSTRFHEVLGGRPAV